MLHTFKAFKLVRSTLVKPSRQGVFCLAFILAGIMGFGGNFLEHNHALKDLNIDNMVEQIHGTLERREELKNLVEKV